MGYSADDFFDDVVKKCESIEDIFTTPADSRGLPKFINHLLHLYGDGSLVRGLHECLLNSDYTKHIIVVYSGDCAEFLGELPPNAKLILDGSHQER